ncbi:hypothetical protein [uncultured Pseudokineococcus sp.]|uniref:hypothetical protein n=1 Tax=uncultured Pseudokineococcus sp. TaxID=1642928 RepID=UPI00260DB6AA|nr:hypothetical protein [uncultured Pseudokineococcus sp.]
MSGGRRRSARGHPWWQQRRATAGRTTALAVFAVLLAAVTVAAALWPTREDGLLRLGPAIFWVPFAASCVAGAVAHRREAQRVDR